MIQIIPAILATTEDQYKNDLSKLLVSASLEEGWVHIDFADNKFVQNQTVGPEIIDKYPDGFIREAHLMVAHPREWVERLVKAGFDRIIFHIESDDNISDVIQEIKSKGIEVGLAINSETPIEKLEPFIGKIDVVLVMSVKPGFQGQSFIPESLEKVKIIKSNNWQVKVGVDGHVDDQNAKEIVDSGVDFMIIGSYLLKGNIDERLEIIWEKING